MPLCPLCVFCVSVVSTETYTQLKFALVGLRVARQVAGGMCKMFARDADSNSVGVAACGRRKVYLIALMFAGLAKSVSGMGVLNSIES